MLLGLDEFTGADATVIKGESCFFSSQVLVS